MGYGKCHECIKFGTMNCPPSSKCMKYDDRPFFEPKTKKKTLIDKIKDIISTI